MCGKRALKRSGWPPSVQQACGWAKRGVPTLRPRAQGALCLPLRSDNDGLPHIEVRLEPCEQPSHAVTIADDGRGGELRYLGEIDNSPDVGQKVVKLSRRYDRLHFYYEAGPTGYGLHRRHIDLGPSAGYCAGDDSEALWRSGQAPGGIPWPWSRCCALGNLRAIGCRIQRARRRIDPRKSVNRCCHSCSTMAGSPGWDELRQKYIRRSRPSIIRRSQIVFPRSS
jgi:hypothetical protein